MNTGTRRVLVWRQRDAALLVGFDGGETHLAGEAEGHVAARKDQGENSGDGCLQGGRRERK